jgi:hypothetical protein
MRSRERREGEGVEEERRRGEGLYYLVNTVPLFVFFFAL